MKLINKFLIIGTVIAALGFTSCSNSEDEPQPGPKMENFFEVPDGDNSPEAQLRRDFYSKTGIYLLFNDVLREYTDAYGNKRTETIDFNWSSLTGDNIDTYRFTYLDTYEDKKQVIEAMEKYLLPYINVDGGQFKPYSFFIANTIEKIDSYGDSDYMSFIKSWRSMGLPAEDWIGLSDEDAKAQGLATLRSIIDAVLDEYSDEADVFFEPVEEYNGEYLDEVFDDWDPDNPDMEAIYNLGFLGYFQGYYSDAFYSKRNDLRYFKDAVFNQTEAEFMEQWGNYPLVVQRYNILKQVITDMGVNFNAVQ